MKRTAIFPGSFNPFTVGHEDILKRGLTLFDHIVIGIGINSDKTEENAESRAEALRCLYAHDNRISVEVYHGLTIDFAKKHQAQFILRGIRSLKDFEYEKDIAEVNRKLSGIDTIILFTAPENACISSSLVRELERYGQDTSLFRAKGTTY